MKQKKSLNIVCVMQVFIFILSGSGLWAEEFSADKKERPTENKIEVIGKRNEAITEVDEATQKLLKVPGIMGDPLAAVYSLPGVVNADGQPAIRGSSPDDNAFYIDFMPAGYIFHSFGGSIFNENLVQKFDLYAAGFGAQFGEATGGVIDVTLRDPNNQDFSGIFDWSLLQTGIKIESGLGHNQAFYASYRMSLIHLYLDKNKEDEDGLTLYVPPESDDYQFKYQLLMGENQKFTLSATGASDNAAGNISEAGQEGRANPEEVGDFRVKDNFDSLGMRWELFSQNGGYLSLALSQLNDSEILSYGDGQFVDSNYKEIFFRGYYQKNWLTNHQITFGNELRKFDFTYNFDIIPYFCTDHQRDCNQQRGDRIKDKAIISKNTYSFYFIDSWKFSPDWQWDLGLRGEHNDYTRETFWMPRSSLTWNVTHALSFTTRVGRYSRFPDADKALRKLGNPNLRSPIADHYTIGASYSFSPIWKAGIDLYYKKMKRLPLALNENDADFTKHYSNDMSGKAHGIELLLEKNKKSGWYAWASLSYSKSNRRNKRTGITKQYYLDTPLIFNLVANYQHNSHWNYGARISIRSGQRYTPIIGLTENQNAPGHFLPVYGTLNGKKLPVYQRVDLQAEYQYQLWGLDAAWTFALINALNHKNVEGYYFAPDGNETVTDYKIATQAGIGAFPAIGFKIKF